MKILYFTSTGNNIHIAKQLGGELLSIPQLIKNNQYTIKDKKVGIIFPVYSFGVASIVKEYLQKAEIKTDYLFAVCSYGSVDSGALRALNSIEKLLKKKGYKTNYLNYVKMIDNFIPLFDIKKEKRIKNEDEINHKINKIKTDIESEQNYHPKFDLISKMTFGDRIIEKGFKSIFKLNVIDGCIECNVCTKVCPKNNIKIENKKPVIGKNCLYCLACVHHCSNSIINPNKKLSDEKYIHPQITVTEIIESNTHE